MWKKLKFKNLLEFIAFLIMVSLIVIMAVQVFARQFLSTIPSWSGEETANFLLIWTVNIGAGIAAGQNAHLALDYLINLFSHQKQRIVEILVYLIVIIFLGVIAVISFQLAWSGRFATTSRLNLSMFWFQSSISAGAMIMLYYYIKHFFAIIRTILIKPDNISKREEGSNC